MKMIIEVDQGRPTGTVRITDGHQLNLTRSLPNAIILETLLEQFHGNTAGRLFIPAPSCRILFNGSTKIAMLFNEREVVLTRDYGPGMKTTHTITLPQRWFVCEYDNHDRIICSWVYVNTGRGVAAWPWGNVDERGKICWGNSNAPVPTVGTTSIAEMDKYFFELPFNLDLRPWTWPDQPRWQLALSNHVGVDINDILQGRSGGGYPTLARTAAPVPSEATWTPMVGQVRQFTMPTDLIPREHDPGTVAFERGRELGRALRLQDLEATHVAAQGRRDAARAARMRHEGDPNDPGF